MRQGQMRVRLQPLDGGAFTEMQLCGTVPTALPPQVMRQLVSTLSFWSGWPVVLALRAEVATAGWFEYWCDAVSGIPARHLELRVRRSRART